MIDVDRFIEDAIRKIREQVGSRRAIIALSGGVDSSTAAVLAHKALGKNLVAVFVDTGLMRKGEPERVIEVFRDKLGMNLIAIDAKKRFLEALKGVEDPEEKRRIIGHLFIEIFEEVAREVGAEVLIQGTIAPDWIETMGGIKSHHNVTLPGGMTLEVVEPLRDLYKHEVREVARRLGLPPEISERMPFPGPGLAVRILGEVTEERLEIVREANAIVEEEVERAGLKPWQAFAALIPVRATGVKGDIRSYGYIIAVRIVESRDAMTANVMRVPWDVLFRIAQRITSEIPSVTRVLYDITHKPPATIEFE